MIRFSSLHIIFAAGFLLVTSSARALDGDCQMGAVKKPKKPVVHARHLRNQGAAKTVKTRAPASVVITKQVVRTVETVATPLVTKKDSSAASQTLLPYREMEIPQ